MVNLKSSLHPNDQLDAFLIKVGKSFGLPFPLGLGFYSIH